MAAGGDPAAGEKIAKKCKACHTFEADGANKIGPHLFGVVGRDIASVPDFKYSDALQGLEGTWTHDKIAAYVADPKGFAPGNKMSFAGIKKEQELADLVAYLETLH
ncbi:MAG: cytochrome c family protein [Geminicoccaceae bacterium]|nr:cytochrome c family protein [Geminicoccaceae bacterium]